MGGVLGEVPVGVPLGEPVGDRVNLGFAEGPLTLDGSGLTGHFSGAFAVAPDSRPKGAKTGAGLFMSRGFFGFCCRSFLTLRFRFSTLKRVSSYF